MKSEWMGRICFNGEIRLRFLDENINSELYVNTLKEKKSKMRNLWGKGLILVRDNVPSLVSDKTAEYLKSIKIKE